MRGLIVKKTHYGQIRRGTKTQTRRQHQRPFKTGETLRLKRSYTTYWGPTMIRITGVRRERLGDCTEADARAEGFRSLEHFRDLWPIYCGGPWDDDLDVVVYDFETWTPSSRFQGSP